MLVFRDWAVMFVRSLKLPARLGAYGMRGCIRGCVLRYISIGTRRSTRAPRLGPNVRSLKQPIRSGVYGVRGCIRGSSPSPLAGLGSLRICAQGAAAAIVGPLGSSLVRVRVSLPSGPWASRCYTL
ncbi:hypothetical protein NDU88_001234 [Pleurodeles waltl]|uniref:Uncharacterized protein n=1 Tax=Pleurodeles waltl TaxID=8319 RepID=A0AAV7SZC1_PLEWA|nr:hypothetical protein NDU88_001234 [Pleurodeles waltl]